MDRINEARMKITEEALAINNNFATFIEEYLNELCTTNEIAEKLLTSDKSLKQFCKNCEDEARKIAQKQGSGAQCAGFPDKEYYRMAREYYGINDSDKYSGSNNIIDITDLL